MIERVRNNLVELACKRQERKNLNDKGRSLSWVSMLNRLNIWMVEYQLDTNIAIMKRGWRDFVKTL